MIPLQTSSSFSPKNSKKYGASSGGSTGVESQQVRLCDYARILTHQMKTTSLDCAYTIQQILKDMTRNIFGEAKIFCIQLWLIKCLLDAYEQHRKAISIL